jgi:hypothetical protein
MQRLLSDVGAASNTDSHAGTGKQGDRSADGIQPPGDSHRLRQVIPSDLRPTVFALATDLALADGRIGDREQAFIDDA